MRAFAPTLPGTVVPGLNRHLRKNASLIMNSLITLDPPVSSLQSAPVLAQSGFTCTLLTLAPDSETALPAGTSSDDQLLFVVAGDIAVHHQGLTTLVNQGGACLIRPGQSPVITARAGQPTQVLRVEIPPRQIITPQLVSPGA